MGPGMETKREPSDCTSAYLDGCAAGRAAVYAEIRNHGSSFVADRDKFGKVTVAECFYCGNHWAEGQPEYHDADCLWFRAHAAQETE
jgi:hypothetical protein